MREGSDFAQDRYTATATGNEWGKAEARRRGQCKAQGQGVLACDEVEDYVCIRAAIQLCDVHTSKKHRRINKCGGGTSSTGVLQHVLQQVQPAHVHDMYMCAHEPCCSI